MKLSGAISTWSRAAGTRDVAWQQGGRIAESSVSCGQCARFTEKWPFHVALKLMPFGSVLTIDSASRPEPEPEHAEHFPARSADAGRGVAASRCVQCAAEPDHEGVGGKLEIRNPKETRRPNSEARNDASVRRGRSGISSAAGKARALAFYRAAIFPPEEEVRDFSAALEMTKWTRGARRQCALDARCRVAAEGFGFRVSTFGFPSSFPELEKAQALAFYRAAIFPLEEEVRDFSAALEMTK